MSIPINSTAMITEFVLYEHGSNTPERFYSVEKMMIAREKMVEKAVAAGLPGPRAVLTEPISIRNIDTLKRVLLEQGYTTEQLRVNGF